MRTMAFRTLLVLAATGTTLSAGADVFTVGPSGRYATIQAALTEAALTPPYVPPTPVTHEIRVQAGTFPENLRLPIPCCGRRNIRVGGGWNASFTSTTGDPASTVIDGRDRGRVFTASALTEGSVKLERLTLREGYLRVSATSPFAAGAGLYASVAGTAFLQLERVHVRDNVIRGEGPGNAEAQGAGASVVVSESGGLSVNLSRFQNNLTVPGEASLASWGGGLNVQVYDRGGVSVSRSEIVGNWAYGSRLSYGGGLYALTEGAARFGVSDTLVQGNVVSNTIGEGAGVALRAVNGESMGGSWVNRCRVVSNVVGLSQVSLEASNGAQVQALDSLVAKGRGGVRVLANNSVAVLRNLTVADNDLRGIRGSVTGGLLTLFNTIAFGNEGGDVSVSGSEYRAGFNLVGTDPRFRVGSYELDGGSPAADAGTNSPPTPLGSIDLAGRPRVYNGTVDIGAYEWAP